MAGCTVCKGCGYPVEESDDFCWKCGAALGCKKVVE